MKNAVPKNDKKRRKQLTEDVAKLEAELNQKHEEEIKQINNIADMKVKVGDQSLFRGALYNVTKCKLSWLLTC